MRSVATLCAMLSGTASATAALRQFDDIRHFEMFPAPSARKAARLAADEHYPSSLVLDIPYQKSVFSLDLTVNQDLFAPGWSLDTFDDEGNLIGSETDASKFMCHYTGSVVGHNASFVTFSICDEVGMTGHIHVDDLDLEVLSTNERGQKSFRVESHNLGEHIIYNMNDLVLPEHHMGSLDMDDSGMVSATNEDMSSRNGYQCDAIIASDSYRMNAYSSSSSEASNSQSIVNAMNTRFANTNWGSGSPGMVTRIQRQRQNPSGWSNSSSIDTYLRNLSAYKESTHPNDDNMIGLTHRSFGSTIGYAWTNRGSSGANPMCHRYSAANVNNVGWSSSNTARGTLVAHEVGHNLRFSHNSGVMSSSISSSNPASSFSSTSISEWNQDRNRWTCLGGGSVSCPDNSSFRDENGYNCADWVGYNCANYNSGDAALLTPEGRLDIQENCRVTCGHTNDDSSYRDENGYRCSDWAGYDCASEDQMSTIGRQELNTYCPQSCGHC